MVYRENLVHKINTMNKQSIWHPTPRLVVKISNEKVYLTVSIICRDLEVMILEDVAMVVRYHMPPPPSTTNLKYTKILPEMPSLHKHNASPSD